MHPELYKTIVVLISSQLKFDLNDDIITILNFLCHMDKENHKINWLHACNVCQWVVLLPAMLHMLGGRRSTAVMTDEIFTFN